MQPLWVSSVCRVSCSLYVVFSSFFWCCCYFYNGFAVQSSTEWISHRPVTLSTSDLKYHHSVCHFNNFPTTHWHVLLQFFSNLWLVACFKNVVHTSFRLCCCWLCLIFFYILCPFLIVLHCQRLVSVPVIYYNCTCKVAVWHSGSELVSNVVNIHPAMLVLGWVTICSSSYVCLVDI